MEREVTAILAALPWGVITVTIGFSVLTWLYIREAKQGAVNQLKADESESVKKVQKALNELNSQIDRDSADAKRQRLRDKYSRD